MEKINDGGPAFPTENEHQTGNYRRHYEGMSLRDYLAGQALMGVLSNRAIDVDDTSPDWIAEYSYKLSDAMLKERSKNG